MLIHTGVMSDHRLHYRRVITSTFSYALQCQAYGFISINAFKFNPLQ